VSARVLCLACYAIDRRPADRDRWADRCVCREIAIALDPLSQARAELDRLQLRVRRLQAELAIELQAARSNP
jgi:hypothetical protein